jgi:hypothetical protein
MNTTTTHVGNVQGPVRFALDREMMTLARRIDAALFLTGSQFYAGRGEDHDYRMVVDDPTTALRRLSCLLPAVSRLIPHADQWACNTIALKFERHGEPVSLQIHRTAFIEGLCALAPVSATILRTTPTSTTNQVFGFETSFETSQPHLPLAPGAWLVEIDQNPWGHREFCTQIYHNMIMASQTMRDAHGFSRLRRRLIQAVEELARQYDVEPLLGFMQVLRRNRERWAPIKWSAFAAELRVAPHGPTPAFLVERPSSRFWTTYASANCH